jgi:hypothetical protein
MERWFVIGESIAFGAARVGGTVTTCPAWKQGFRDGTDRLDGRMPILVTGIQTEVPVLALKSGNS